MILSLLSVSTGASPSYRSLGLLGVGPPVGHEGPEEAEVWVLGLERRFYGSLASSYGGNQISLKLLYNIKLLQTIGNLAYLALVHPLGTRGRRRRGSWSLAWARDQSMTKPYMLTMFRYSQ
jgi:hypothetical protein